MPQLHRLAIPAAVALVGAVAAVVFVATRRAETPAEERLPPPRFVETTAEAGIRFRHVSGAGGKKLLPETMGAGVAVLDFDGDGRPDLFFVNGRPWPGDPYPATGRPTQALYRNRGDGTFEDVTVSAGLDVTLYGLGVAVGDYDNDGRPDLLITAVGGCRLFRNVDGKRFEDVTAGAGLGDSPGWPAGSGDDFLGRAEPLTFPASAAFLDYDGDGRLDLFVCHYLTWSPAADLGVRAVLPNGVRAYVPPQQFPAAQCQLFRNVDGKRFEDVSATAGVQVDGGGKALGVVVCDPDRDGWPDLVVANDSVRNFFFHNVPAPGGGRRFEEIAIPSGVAYADGRPRGGMGIDAAELEPGVVAVVVANFSDEPNSLFHPTRRNPLQFFDAAAETGLAGPSRAPMKFGVVFFDFDLDGRPDLFTCNGHLEPDIGAARPGQWYRQPGQLFRNAGTGSPRFELVPPEAKGGPTFPAVVGRGCAYLDYDGDGAPDLVVTENNGPARLFRNANRTGNRAVRVVLTGDGPGMTRDATGAEVTVEAGGRVRRWYVSPTRGYLSQSEAMATFGLGLLEKVDRLAVRWPGAAGRTDEWRDLAAGATYHVRPGGTPRAVPFAGR